MATLHIEHAITDIGTWLAAFDGFAEQRNAAGVREARIAMPVDDPHYLVVDLEFAGADEAGRFLGFLQSVVWASSESSPALVGAPRALVLESVPIGARR